LARRIERCFAGVIPARAPWGSVVVVEVLEGVDALGGFVDVERQVRASVELISPSSVAAFVELGPIGAGERQATEMSRYPVPRKSCRNARIEWWWVRSCETGLLWI
jgi:hypothetical protein